MCFPSDPDTIPDNTRIIGLDHTRSHQEIIIIEDNHHTSMLPMNHGTFHPSLPSMMVIT